MGPHRLNKSDGLCVAACAALGLLLIAWAWKSTPRPPSVDARLQRLVEQLGAELPPHYNWVDKRLGPGGLKVPAQVTRQVIQADSSLAVQRKKAANDLIALGTNAWPAIPYLVGNIANTRSSARFLSIRVLVEIEAWDSVQWPLACRTLTNLADPAILSYFGILSGAPSRRSQQFAIALALALGHPAATNTVPGLFRLLDDDTASALWPETTAALARLGANCDALVARLIGRLNDSAEWPDRSAAAAVAMARLPAQRNVSVPALRHALQDPRALVRIRAAEALHRLGVSSQELRPTLIAATRHNLPSIRAGASEILKTIDSAAAGK